MSILIKPRVTSDWSSNIANLYSIDRWIAWHRDDVRGKVPINVATGRPHNAGDPAIWMPYADAMRAEASGVGFVLTGDGICVIDFDTYKLGADEENGDRELGANLWQQVLKHQPSYTEQSPSGEGAHVVGYIDEATRARIGNFQVGLLGCIDILANRCYSTMTGHAILDVQYADISKLVNYILDEHVRLGGRLQLPMTGAELAAANSLLGRYVERQNDELRGEALIDAVTNKCNKKFRERLNTVYQPGEHHREFAKLLGDMCKVRCSRDAAYDVLVSSVFIKNSPVHAKSREPRERKLYRLMLRHEGDIRRNYWDKSVVSFERWDEDRQYHIEFGRKIAAQLDIAKAEAIAARALPAQVVAASVAPGTQSRFSPSAMRAIEQLTIASGIDEKYLSETAPPGPIGEFVECVAMGMYEPFLSFAIPASLSGLAGITARGLKLADSQGTNIFNLLFAQTSTGKSQSVEAFETFLADVRERGGKGFPDGVNMPEYFRAIDLISRQGAHKPFQDAPSSCWVEEECWRILDLIINPGKGSGAFSPSDFVNKLFDLSKLTKLHHPPASIRSRGDKELPIANLSQSIYWVTTATNAAKVLGRDVIDTGAASRMIPLLHLGSAGIEHGDLSHRMQTLPQRLRDRLLQLVVRSMDLQIAYNVAAAAGKHCNDDIRKLVIIANMDPAAADLFDRNRKALGKFKRGIQDGILDYPSTYIMFSRIAMLSQRIAAQIAYFNSDSAVIDHEALSWATGHLAQRIGTFLTAFDRGDMGEALEDGEMTILKAIKELLRQGKGDAAGFVHFSDLSQVIRNRSPFSKDRAKATVEIRKTLYLMEQESMIVGRKDPSPTNTGTSYAMTSHKCWDSIL
ncbi:hypothetical protein ELI30_09405 [Rhizobium leguminosarum]|uniref:hypothetical protein n=1 Tax=Rhizobium leguminosarum TaxID=384 RepID=UPI00102F73B2|nr:hypothetical protein [Rhizobium leguminosarum]TAV48500.1 hypothetical protein ELI32_09860 [Rhizobium leguminosarum]TAV58000.1 hypothetical protein ELI31_09390 [Rhizobium leguminosarum]TAV68941.1 hypothetical protein ELI30_09405 [Rhizobium leguminosarum]